MRGTSQSQYSSLNVAPGSGAAGMAVNPAKWAIGPPAPGYVAWLARGVMIALVVVVGHWVQSFLGGVSTAPGPTNPLTGANDTGKLFNWHPVLMTLAFGVFMAEAVLTYQAPIIKGLARPVRKKIHYSLHSLALLCALLGVIAANKSHTLKLPTPIPNFYSAHSYLGLTVLILLSIQFLVGLISYLWPTISLPSRLALGPIHKFSGKLVWVTALATMATGFQEKSTFIQAFGGLAGDKLYGGVMKLPATAEVLLVVLGALVLYHQVPVAKALDEDRQARQGLLAGTTADGDGEEA